MVTIIRGILEEIPVAYSLLDEAIIEIVGRNEKERGKDYFMKYYAPNSKDGSSKKSINQIVGRYNDQQKKPLGERKKRYIELTDVLLRRMGHSDQNVPDHDSPAENVPGQAVPDQIEPAQSVPEQDIGRPQDANPPVSVPHTESPPVAFTAPATDIADSTALATPSSFYFKVAELGYPPWLTQFPLPTATISEFLESVTATLGPIWIPDMLPPAPTSASTAGLPVQTDEALTTIHPLVTITEPLTITIHPTVTATEPSTTTGHSVVMATATPPSTTTSPSIAKVTATSFIILRK